MCAKANSASGAAGFRMPLRTSAISQQKGCSWYAVHVDRGAEDSIAAKLNSVLPRECLADAFVLKKERWMKFEGVWRLCEVPLYPEYVIASSNDAKRLAYALRKASFRAELVGEGASVFATFDDAAASGLRNFVDKENVIRASVGEIKDGRLNVVSGPLVGQESCISKVDRHKRACVVELGGEGCTCTEMLALNIPVKH